MRWLLVKDLQILRRSPLLVALLVIYPVVIAVLIGLALSRGPDKPRVAFVNEVPASAETIDIGGERVQTSRYADILFRAIDPVRARNRDEALAMVREGDVLGALIIPADITSKLQTGLEPATVEVFYNAEDPVKARFIRDTIKSQVQDANSALTKKFTEVAVGYLDLIVSGGEFSFFGREFDVLGLEKAEQILRGIQAGQPAGERAALEPVIRFARLARENLDLSDEVLTAVGTPIRVEQTVLRGGRTPLDAFAVAIAVTVSLMFVTLLLAAGTLALEREENAFARLVRGLVSRTGLLAEKGLLAAGCAFIVALLMLCGLALFVDLAWERFGLWVAALAAGAAGFAALGLAIGAVTREVRAASLLAFMLSLPIAFLALVPSGSVSAGLYDVIRIVSGAFPFRPALTATNAALNDSDGFGTALLHLGALTVVFGAISRLALRRFA